MVGITLIHRSETRRHRQHAAHQHDVILVTTALAK